jgi:hypothetical protein
MLSPTGTRSTRKSDTRVWCVKHTPTKRTFSLYMTRDSDAPDRMRRSVRSDFLKGHPLSLQSLFHQAWLAKIVTFLKIPFSKSFLVWPSFLKSSPTFFSVSTHSWRALVVAAIIYNHLSHSYIHLVR